MGHGKNHSPSKMVASQQLNSDFPEVIEEEASLNGGPSIQINEVHVNDGPKNSVIVPQATLIGHMNEQSVVEFEHALMSLNKIPSYPNPCVKRTMALGPKKFVGYKPNQQIHQHTNTKLKFTDFDTIHRANSAK